MGRWLGRFHRRQRLVGDLPRRNQALRELIEGSKPERIARQVKELLVGDRAFLERLRAELAGAPRQENDE